MLKINGLCFFLLFAAGVFGLTACGDDEPATDECANGFCDSESENTGGDSDSDSDTGETTDDSDTLPPLDNFDSDQYGNPEAACDPQPENMNLTAEITETGDGAWVAQCMNRFGLQGVWYSYDDQNGGSTSTIEMDYTQASAGKICAVGEGAQVLMGDYSKYWGAGFGLNLCSVGPEDARVEMPIQGCELLDPRTKVIGFRITVEGEFPVGGSELRVQFSEEGRSESAYIVVTEEGTADYLFADAEVTYAVLDTALDAEPVNPDQIISLQLQISTKIDGTSPFNFCVSNIIPILE